MDTPTITARITGTGTDSAVPDNETAVDACIYCGSVQLGEATLLADDAWRLTPWGSLDNWADARLIAHLETLDSEDRARAIAEIVAAISAAAAAG